MLTDVQRAVETATRFVTQNREGQPHLDQRCETILDVITAQW